MPTILYTVDNLASEVRSLLDEQNNDSVDTTNDILPALNRAQLFAFDVLARKYPEPILDYISPFQLNNGQNEYDMPNGIFEDRILKVEVSVPSGQLGQPQGLVGGATQREVQRVSFRDISNYESASKTNIPYYYCIIGRRIRFVPTPTGTYKARIWILRQPEKLVSPQGRITVVNSGAGYIVVDSAGSALTTEADQLGSYVNIVDGASGVIKSTLQIGQLANNRLTFRTVPTRTIVLGRTVVGNLTTPNDTNNPIGLDDYVCPVDGICVPFYGTPTTNFMVQFAVSQIRGQRLGGGAAQEEELLVQKFEQQVERTWVGRERQMRIQKRSNNWGVPTRRWYYE